MSLNERERIVQVNIEDQMKSAYIDYSMSVIVSRALPDVRDGLKPVHRRVLFGMYELGVMSNRGYKKSARIVGEVLGKYHPHGDSSVYYSMVRMAQDWSLRYPFVDGQGNFGSVDGDSPAAMRYTEARLKKIAEEMLVDIDKETVDFKSNFDDSLQEPTVLPSKIPSLLLNGASGIAVGMATNMAPHNLTEVVDGIIAYIDNKEITIDELMKFIKAPDFPTGGTIYGYDGVLDAFKTGRGRIVLRAKWEIENEGERDEKIIVTEIPYQVNKSELIKSIADLVNDKKIEGISDLRDESDRTGMRIVFELRNDAITSVVVNQLYQYSALQTAFNVNNIALVNGRPRLLNLKDLIKYFVEHRHEVIIRRTEFEKREAEKRAHILEGLLIALDNIDEVISIIRASKAVDEARENLMKRFDLSDLQSRAIVDMRLRALTGLERDKLKDEFDELMKLIERLTEILGDENLRMQVIKNELLDMKEKYGDEPKTDIIYEGKNFRIEDTIADEEMVITISHMGYVKRTQLTEYRSQNRGGKGHKGSEIRDADFVEHLFVASMHDYMLFFTEKGKVYWMRVYEIPEGSRKSKGRPIQNLIQIDPDDKVRTYLNTKDINDPEYTANNYIVMCTKKGIIKKTTLEAYSRPRQKGIIAINIREDDQLLQASITSGNDEIIMALKSGRAIRFNETKVRPMGRGASGVKGVTLGQTDDEVVGMVCISDLDSDLLVVSQRGYGKRSKIEEYRITNRGGKGVKTMNISSKTGLLVGILNVTDEDDLMIINKSGVIIRMHVADLRTMGRATQGVRLINMKKSDSIASIAKVEKDDEEEVVELDPNAEVLSDLDPADMEDEAEDEIEDDVEIESESENEEKDTDETDEDSPVDEDDE